MKSFLIVLLGLFLFAAACIPSTTSLQTESEPSPSLQAPMTVTDALGRSVTFQATPQRIVIAGKGLFMIADAAYIFPEASLRVVGMGDAGQGTSNFIALIDPDYESKAVLEGDVSAEEIAALLPDVVIMKSYLADTAGAPLEALGIPVVYVDFETPEQFPRDLAILGQLFQNESRALEIIDYYQSTLQRIRQVVGEIASRPSVLMLYYNDRDGTVAFNVPPQNWMQTRIVEEAGGIPAWADANPGQGWTQVTLEQIALWDADYIFIITYNRNPSEVVADLQSDPSWQALRAPQEEHLFAFPGDLYSWDQPDPRWILGLMWMAEKLHPQSFPDLDMMNQARFFYQTLYDLDDAAFDATIQPNLRGDLP